MLEILSVDSECSSVDESMVEYFGKHGAKQCIRNKPIRYGFKVWTHNLSNGYLINFDYCGKCSNSFTQKYSEEFTLPNSVILGFADFLTAGSQLYFDNYFSSVSLMDELSHRKILATGTLRENMIMRCPVTPKGKMKKQPRGKFEVFHDLKGDLIRWLDNAVVTQISNFDNADPVGQARRWSSNLKKSISVDIHHSVSEYDKNMGGSDRMNQNTNKYKVRIRSRKWWNPLYRWDIDISLNNAWILFKESKGSNMDFLEFRRRVVLEYLQKHGKDRKPKRYRPSCLTENTNPRYDGKGHFICCSSRLRCRVCGNKTVKSCLKCKVNLHEDCFVSYHTL